MGASPGAQREADRTRRILLGLFFLSGACGLVYEVVWMRMLTLVFGATAYATSTILASFFAGLALGGFLFGRLIDRRGDALVTYAVLEGGIGVSAFLMPLALSGLTDLYVVAARGLELGYVGLTVLRFVGSFAVLLIPATLMGGTLPVVVRYFARVPETLGRNVGWLYAVNTLGAVVGTLSAGFFLILMIGAREATYVAATVNLAIAASVLILSRREGSRPTPRGGRASDARDDMWHPGGGKPAVAARMALMAVGVAGFCALALEVLWTRALVFFLDNSTHAFTTMLTAFLLGIALGSALFARHIDARSRPLSWLGGLQVLIGISAVAALPILGHSTPVLQSMAEAPLDAGLFWRWTGMRFVVSLSVMLLPTLLMGMTFPLAAKICASRMDRVGAALGQVYAVNTVGGVGGALAAGFVLLPLVGLQSSVLLMAAVSAIMGGALVAFDPAWARVGAARALVAMVMPVLGAVAFVVGRGSLVLTSFIEGLDSTEVLAYEEGVGATVKVFRDDQGARYLSIDGFPVAGTSLGLHDAQKALGNLPMLLSNVPSARVNLIGFGAGGASWGVLQYDVSRVDCVELVPAVVDAADWFSEVNHGVLNEPRFNLIVGDGRNHALISDRTYDVISIDATSPKMAGNGSLYTLDFYELLADRLSVNGIAVQWVPIHLLSDREVRMTIKTFMMVFPHTTLWFSAIRHHALLVGSREALQIDLASLTEKLVRRGVRAELAPLQVDDTMDVLGWFVAGEGALAPYVAEARVNSDNHPYLEFAPAMAYFASTGYLVQNLLNFRELRESPLPWVADLGETPAEVAAVESRIRRRFDATQHSINGDVLYYLGRYEEAQRAYEMALSIDPGDKNWAHPAWRGVVRPDR